MLFIHDDDQLELSRQIVAALRVAAAPGDLLRIGSSPMEGIAFVANTRISHRRRAQRGSRDFYHGLLAML